MTRNESPRRSFTVPVFITLAGALIIAGLAALPWVGGAPAADDESGMAAFIGRFHPVVLHLPIGMLGWVLIRELLNMLSRRPEPPSSRTAMGFAAISAVVAALLGFILYHSSPDYASDLAERHLYGGLAFACSAVAAFVIKSWVDACAGAGTLVYRGVLLASTAIMGFASHDGASLTHGKGYLTDHAPEALRKLLGLPPRGHDQDGQQAAENTDPVVYTGIIAPILESKCYSCHNVEKRKGRYRMDEYDLLLAGGKEGPAIEPGDSAGSNVIVRIELPKDDDEHMPPEGKKDIAEHELLLLKWWIDQGASRDATLSAMPVDEAVKSALAKLAPAAETAVAAAEALAAPDTAQTVVIERLMKRFPAALSYEAQDSRMLVFSAAGLREKFTDAELEQLAPALPFMVSLDLSYTALSDSSAPLLAKATALKSLRLAGTKISDSALLPLSDLTQLESLNLYGTRVTNAGIRQLASLTSLKRLYLWQSGVDAEGVRALQQQLPDCEIDTGL